QVRQIADPPLDLERLAHGVITRDLYGAGRYLGQPQHHQNGGCFAGTIRPQEAECLAFDNVEVEGVDDNGLAIALGEAPRSDDGRAHRRPNLRTAPNINANASAMRPNPTIPHVVEVATVTRNWVEAVSPREAARIVAM